MTKPKPKPMLTKKGGLGVTRWQLVGILTITVTMFVFWGDPIWERAWSPDANILWSYVPIPFLVGACQGWNGSFGVRRWLIASFVIALAKYLLTATILLTLLAATKPPAREKPEKGESPVTHVETRAVKLSLPPIPANTPRGSLSGRVEAEGDGAVLDSAVAFLALEDNGWSYPEDSTPSVLTLGAGRLAPSLQCMRQGTPLHVKITDGGMHTVQAFTRSGQYLFNAPTPSDREIPLSGAKGLIHLRCAIHAAESADIEILTHPYFTEVKASGEFEIPDVPAGKHELALWRRGSRPQFAAVEVKAGAKARVRAILGAGTLEVRQE